MIKTVPMKQLSPRVRMSERPVPVWSLRGLSISWLKRSCWEETMLHGQNWFPVLEQRHWCGWRKVEHNNWAGASHAILPFLPLGRQVSRILSAGYKPVSSPKHGFYKPNHKQKLNLGMQNSLRNPKEKYQLSICSQRSWEESLNKRVP